MRLQIGICVAYIIGGMSKASTFGIPWIPLLVFMNMAENPALHLSESMILGLLDELSSMDNPLIAQFCDILAEHPVSRSSRVRSLAPSMSDSTTVMDLSLDSPNSPSHLYTATSEDASEKSGGLDSSGSEAIHPLDDPNLTCCRNGIKRATFGTAAKRSNAKSGKGMVTAEVDKQDSRGRGDRVADDVRDTNGRERSVVDKGEEGGGMVGGDNDGLEEEINGSNESSDGGEYAADRSGGKRKRKGGRRGKKAKKAKVHQPPVWLTDGSPPDLASGTDYLITELSHIISNANLQSLVDLTQLLIKPDSITPLDGHTLTLGSLIAVCAEQESKQMLADFRHMILLIRLAFHLERQVFTPSSN